MISDENIYDEFGRIIYKYSNKIIFSDNYNYSYPNNNKFAVVLTHDIDIIKPDLLSYIYLPSFIMKKNKKFYYDNIYNLINIEKDNSLKSTFFLKALFPFNKDFRYFPWEMYDVNKTLIRSKFELGLHGSKRAANNIRQLKNEIKIFELFYKTKPIGYRNHALTFNYPKTWKNLEKCGIMYDSTYGYFNYVGYWNNSRVPFHPLDNDKNSLKIFELPLNIMDSSMFDYLNLTSDQSWRIMKNILDYCSASNNVLTINWHNTAYDGKTKDVYDKFINYCLMNDCWICDAVSMIKWFAAQ
jgi:hypothetical protein